MDYAAVARALVNYLHVLPNCGDDIDRVDAMLAMIPVPDRPGVVRELMLTEEILNTADEDGGLYLYLGRLF